MNPIFTRNLQLPAISAAAQAALEQNRLDPSAYDEIVLWMDEKVVKCRPQPDERAIRLASALMVLRLVSSSTRTDVTGVTERYCRTIFEAGGRYGPLPL